MKRQSHLPANMEELRDRLEGVNSIEEGQLTGGFLDGAASTATDPGKEDINICQANVQSCNRVATCG